MNPMTNLTDVNQADRSDTDNDDYSKVLRKLVHKLSQPLTTLSGSVEVALMGRLSEPECRKVLELVFQESNRMAESLATLREVIEMKDSAGGIRSVCWTESIETVLKEVSSTAQNGLPQLASSLSDDVWVKANPWHLDSATRRLIGGVIKSGCGEQSVRVGLSVRGEVACMSICAGKQPADTECISQGKEALVLPTILEESDLDWWIVRHAIECQGGWVNVSRVSETCFCYQLNLPLASPKVAHPA